MNALLAPKLVYICAFCGIGQQYRSYSSMLADSPEGTHLPSQIYENVVRRTHSPQPPELDQRQSNHSHHWPASVDTWRKKILPEKRSTWK